MDTWNNSGDGVSRIYSNGATGVARPGRSKPGTFTGILYSSIDGWYMKRGHFATLEEAQKWCDRKNSENPEGFRDRA